MPEVNSAVAVDRAPVGQLTLRATALLGAVLTSLATLLWSASPALAHAELQNTYPQAGQQLPSSPETITLTFNEQVETDQSQIRLLNSTGQTVTTTLKNETDTSADADAATELTLTPAEPLGPGNWVVAWTVVSADGHIISGALDFSVGPPGSAAAAGQQGQKGNAVEDDPALSQTSERARASEIPDRVLEGIGWLGGIAAAMLLAGSNARKTTALLGGIGAAAAALYGLSIGLAMPSASLAFTVGEVRAATFSAGAGLAALVGAGFIAKKARQQVGALGLLLFSLQGLWSGHHLIDAHATVIVAHIVHLGAGAAWIGAVAALAASTSSEQAIRTRRQATTAIMLLIPASLILVVGTSKVLTTGLTLNQWALVLSIKVAMVLTALGVGLANHRALSAKKLADTLAQPGKIAKFMRIEIAAMVVVIAASATLTLYTPAPVTAQATAPTGSETGAGAEPGEESEPTSRLIWPGTANLELESGGMLTLRITLDESGDALVELTTPNKPPAGSGAVELSAQGPSEIAVNTYLEPTEAGWAGNLRLPLPGHWDLEATIPVDAFTQETATGHIQITAPGEELGSSSTEAK